MPGAPAAVLLGDHEPEQARVAEDLEDVLGVGGVGVDLAGPRARSCPAPACGRVAWSSTYSGARSNDIEGAAY